MDRLEEVVLGSPPQVAGVDRQIHVGLGLVTLGPDPLPELGVVAGQELDVDPGLVLVLLEGGLDPVVTARVDGEGRPALAAARCQQTAAGERRQRQDADAKVPTLRSVCPPATH